MIFIMISGGMCGPTKRRTIVGGYVFTWWFVTDVQRLSLEVMTLNPICENVETAQGVPLTVSGVAQCKIMKADELLATASEQFLGKTVNEIKCTILYTLEGHLRAILGLYSWLQLMFEHKCFGIPFLNSFQIRQAGRQGGPKIHCKFFFMLEGLYPPRFVSKPKNNKYVFFGFSKFRF